jgi:hypothetical protein
VTSEQKPLKEEFVNNPPIANAGPNEGVEEGTGVTLDGSKSNIGYSCHDLCPLIFRWNQVFGQPIEIS